MHSKVGQLKLSSEALCSLIRTCLLQLTLSLFLTIIQDGHGSAHILTTIVVPLTVPLIQCPAEVHYPSVQLKLSKISIFMIFIDLDKISSRCREEG